MKETKRESFVFYRSFLEAIEQIPGKLRKAQAYKVIVEYGLNGIEPKEPTDCVVKIIFTQAKPQIDASNKRHNNCVENGKKGGAPKGNTNAQKTTKETTKELTKKTTKKQPKNNHNVNDNDNVNVNDNLKERDKSLPTQNDVLQSLSQYKNFKINIELDTSKFDVEQIALAISKSEYLQGTNLSFVVENYEKVITGYYDKFVYPENIKQVNKSNHNERHYKKEEYQAMYTNIEDIEI